MMPTSNSEDRRPRLLRGSAGQYFLLRTCLFAPLWIAERTFSTYWAFYWFFIHGGYPFGDRILKKGTGRDGFEGGRVTASSISHK